MTTILENPYKGINAHFHSLVQSRVGISPSLWTSFHASHIATLVAALNRALPLNYLARVEQSLQIWTGKILEDEVNGDSFSSELTGDTSPVLIIHLPNQPGEEITIPSVAIYQVHERELSSKPVTRIELISPNSKHGGRGLDGYRKNRLSAILGGTSLIELDYLHESKSPLFGIPTYPDERNSQPYYLAMTDCRSGYPKEMRAYMRAVNQPLPSELPVPLAGDESIVLDCEAAYQETFQSGRWGIQLDYSQSPANFKSYSLPDQTSIQSVINSIKHE